MWTMTRMTLIMSLTRRASGLSTLMTELELERVFRRELLRLGCKRWLIDRFAVVWKTPF